MNSLVSISHGQRLETVANLQVAAAMEVRQTPSALQTIMRGEQPFISSPNASWELCKTIAVELNGRTQHLKFRLLAVATSDERQDGCVVELKYSKFIESCAFPVKQSQSIKGGMRRE
jgi:hypothetical protein